MRISLLLLGILLSAVAANAIWLYEIIYRIGWAGTQWVGQHYYTIYLINFLTVNAFLMPICLRTKYSKSYWKSLAVLYTISLAAFYLAKPLFLSFFTPLFFLAIIVVLVSLAYYAVVYFFLGRLSLLFIPILCIVIVSVIFESMFVSTNFAIYGSTGNFADAVKMGYAYFFITLNMGLMGLLTHFLWLRDRIGPVSEDILDDEWV